jgi:hypothetical protein
MTELIQQVIAQIEKLPPDGQYAIAYWLLTQLQDEEKSLVVDISDSWDKQDRSDVTDFSLQYVDSTDSTLLMLADIDRRSTSLATVLSGSK